MILRSSPQSNVANVRDSGFERLLLAVGLVAAASAWLFTRLGLSSPSCLFRDLSGYPCPSCGGTRAVRAMVTGDFQGAFLLNPLAVLLILSGLFAVLYAAGVVLFGIPPWRPRLGRAGVMTLRLLMVAALLGNEWYLLRNLG
jgi:hypothetical protein